MDKVLGLSSVLTEHYSTSYQNKQQTNQVTLSILLYFLSHQMNLTATAMHPLMAILGYGSSSKVFEYFLLFDTTVKVGNRYPLEQA